MGEVAEIAKRGMEAEGERLTRLRDKLIKGVLDKIDYFFFEWSPN